MAKYNFIEVTITEATADRVLYQMTIDNKIYQVRFRLEASGRYTWKPMDANGYVVASFPGMLRAIANELTAHLNSTAKVRV